MRNDDLQALLQTSVVGQHAPFAPHCHFANQNIDGATLYSLATAHVVEARSIFVVSRVNRFVAKGRQREADSVPARGYAPGRRLAEDNSVVNLREHVTRVNFRNGPPVGGCPYQVPKASADKSAV